MVLVVGLVPECGLGGLESMLSSSKCSLVITLKWCTLRETTENADSGWGPLIDSVGVGDCSRERSEGWGGGAEN